MPTFKKDGRRLLFIHVPKAGGTTIERRLERAGWSMGFRATGATDDHFGLRRVSPQHYHGAILPEILRLGRFDVIFMLVRDPLARFRSEYAHRNKEPGQGKAELVSTWADDYLARYQRDPYVLDNHLRPQHEFLVPNTQVYRLEDGIETMLADLNGRFGVGVPTAVGRRMDSNVEGRLGSRDVELTDELTERLRAMYAADYETFGYDR